MEIRVEKLTLQLENPFKLSYGAPTVRENVLVHITSGTHTGVNIKLAKCGRLRPACQMIALARAYGMQVMLGCMIESSVAVTAAPHLAPLVDYADLDGNLLITNDPYHGVQMRDRWLMLPDGPGLGITRVL